MAHNIEIVNGEAKMAYVGETPWHGLGVELPADVSPREMMVAAGLDWKVEKHPLQYRHEGDILTAGDKRALVRSSDGSMLDIVSESWNPVQNEQAFDFFQEFCDAGDMTMHTAGSLKGGQMTWVLAKVNESFDLFQGDQVDNYLLFSNPHKFGAAIDVRMTPVRVVCNNTLTMSLKGKASAGMKLNHRTAFDKELALETLGLASEKLEMYKEMAGFLGSKRYTEETVVEYFNRVFPKTNGGKFEKFASRNSQAAYELLETQPGANFAEGSWWTAFNAVTYLTDHHMGREQEGRLYNSWYGYNKDRKRNAAELAVEMAEAA